MIPFSNPTQPPTHTALLRRSLRVPVLLKITLPLILIIVLSVGLSSYRVYQATVDRWQTDQDRRLRRMAEWVAWNVNPDSLGQIDQPTDIDSPEYIQIQQQLDQAVKAGNLSWVGIYYYKNNLFYYWVDQGYTGVGYPFFYATAEHLTAWQTGQTLAVRYTDEFGSYYGFVVPITITDESGATVTLGLVEAVIDQESGQLLERKTLSSVLPILVVGILIAIGLTIVFTTFMFHRPLRQLEQGVLKLAQGQLGHMIPLRSNDELGDLATAFNRMSGELAQLYQQLEQYNHELEDRVEARTTDLRRERNRLDTIIQNIADGLVVTGRDGTILLVNPAFAQVVEQPLDALPGRALSEVAPSPELNVLLTRALAQPGEPLSVNLSWAAPATEPRMFKISACAIKEDSANGNGPEPLGVVAILRDITYEAQVDRMKTDFISMVSHELRTPLTSVLGFAKLIGKSFEKNILPLIPPRDQSNQRAAQRIRDNLDIIIGEGERLTRLINDVLDIAKIESGKIEWHMQEVQIHSIISSAVTATASLASDKNLPVYVEVTDDLPLICADRDRMIQVITNLLSNAIKFTDQGEIRVTAGRLPDMPALNLPSSVKPTTGEWIGVRIQDSGIGISAQDLPKIFDKFKQVGDTLRNRPSGTGLGLTICKEIVEHHGGHIWAESKPSVGTSLTFILPAMSGHLLPQAESPLLDEIRRRVALALPEMLSQERRNIRILVVDDEAHIRELLRQSLTEVGYQVIQAVDGVDALRQARETHPDLIILDLMLPGISGFDVISALRNDPDIATIPVMILSVLTDREKGFRLGADAYSTKPINMDEIMSTIERLLGRPGTGEQASPDRQRVLIIDQNQEMVEAIAQVFAERHYEVIKAYNSQDGLDMAVRERPRFIILGATVSRLNDHQILHTLKYTRETRESDIVLMSAMS